MKEVNSLTRQIKVMQERLSQLQQGVCSSIQLKPELLPQAFKDLGIVSEKLQLAVQQLQQQHLELEEAHKALQMEHQFYQDLFELSNDAYVTTSITGVLQEANSAAAALLNVSKQFLIGRPFVSFVAPAERKSLYAQLLHMQFSTQTKELRVKLCPHQGEPFSALIVAAVVRDLEGRAERFHLCIRKDSNAPTPDEQQTNRDDFTTAFPKQVYLKAETIPPEVLNVKKNT